MKSLILAAAVKFIAPLQILFSLYVLLRGHNEPGGGFVGGLIASCTVALVLVTHDGRRARSFMILSPAGFTLWGLAAALASGLPALIAGQPYMTGRWVLGLPLPGTIKLGTPLLFDIGVYLVIIGITTSMILTLAEDEE